MKKFISLELLLWCLVGVQAQKTLPYSYGFENGDLSTEGWTTFNPSGNNAVEFGIYDGASYESSGHCFRFSSYNYDSSNEYDQYLFSPALDGSKGVEVQFYYCVTRVFVETFKVGYSTTNALPASFTWEEEISTISTNWQQSDKYTFPEGTKYVAFCYCTNGSSRYRFLIDNISFMTPPECAKPQSLTVSGITAEGATFTWKQVRDTTKWQYTVVAHGVSPDWSNAAVINDTTVAITGLASNTGYDFYARMYCSAGEQSEVSSLSFLTACEPITVFPWSDGFEQDVNCWTFGNVQNNEHDYYIPEKKKTSPHSGNYSLYMSAYRYVATAYDYREDADSAYAVLPEMDFGAGTISDCSMTFYARSYDSYESYNQHFYVGVVNSPDSMDTFVQVADLTVTPAYAQYEVSFASYQGTGKYIVLLATIAKNYDNWVLHGDFYVDDIQVFYTPSCQPLSSVTIGDIERRAIEFELHPKADEDFGTYELVCSATELDNAALETAGKTIVNTPEYRIEGLERETTYFIYVRTVCDAGLKSDWVSASATTRALYECEDMVVGTGISSVDWEVPMATVAHNSYTQQLYRASEINHQAGTIDKIAFAYDCSSTTTRNITVFMANTDMGALPYYLTSGFVQVTDAKDIEFNSDEPWFTIDLDYPFDYTGENIVVAVYMCYTPNETMCGSGRNFRQTSTGFVEWNNYLTYLSRYQIYDNDDLTPIPISNGVPVTDYSNNTANRANIRFSFCHTDEACPAVSDLSYEPVGSGNDETVLRWNSSGADYFSGFDVILSTIQISDFSGIAPTYAGIAEDSVRLSSLTPATTYYAYVRTVCQADGVDEGESEWTSVSFTMNNPHTAVEPIEAQSETAVKLFMNGQIYILRKERIYTLQGQEITVP